MTKQMGRPPKPKGSTHPHKRMCRFNDAQLAFLEGMDAANLSDAIRQCVDMQMKIRNLWVDDEDV